MLDTTNGEIVNTTLLHEGDGVRELYSKLPRPVRVGIEATGSMHWFLNLTGELRIDGLNCAKLPFEIAEGLIRRHYSDANIEAILGGNFRRVLRESEPASSATTVRTANPLSRRGTSPGKSGWIYFFALL